MKFRSYDKKDEVEVKGIFTQYWTDNEFLKELAEEIQEKASTFYVVEKRGEIVGVAGLRQAPAHLSVYADTKNPAELYIIASKYQNKGVGHMLGKKTIEEAKNLKFTEIVCYSPTTHSSSWRFYEKLGFTRHGIVNDPDDGYPGMLWRKTI